MPEFTESTNIRRSHIRRDVAEDETIAEVTELWIYHGDNNGLPIGPMARRVIHPKLEIISNTWKEEGER